MILVRRVQQVLPARLVPRVLPVRRAQQVLLARLVPRVLLARRVQQGQQAASLTLLISLP